MSAINNGGPAFPCDPFVASRPGNEDVAKRLAEGMTLRDYFAAKAMQGVLAFGGQAETEHVDDSTRWIALDHLARTAYLVADAMLEARK